MAYYFILNNKLRSVSTERQVVINEQAQAGEGIVLDEEAYQSWAALYNKTPTPIKPDTQE